ncbi:MAG: hypothetical protein PHZ19_11155 [Candidatus Thermoplasmatota archaeon]|nr:hypothetical protein [Candidatus Thermoplasmatota archaeon]
MPLFDTVLEQVEIGPASLFDSGNTAGSGNSGYTVKGSNEGWHLFVKPGDYIYLGSAVNDGALITEVVDANTLKISKQIAANETEFSIYRPTELAFRPPMGVEWEIHNIVVSPRIDAGPTHNMHRYPVEVWSTDDNKPKTLLFTTQDYSLVYPPNESGNDSESVLRFGLKISETWITLKPTYFGWILIRNYYPVRVDAYFNGIEKTIRREGV